jgi:hypothetical protein
VPPPSSLSSISKCQKVMKKGIHRRIHVLRIMLVLARTGLVHVYQIINRNTNSVHFPSKKIQWNLCSLCGKGPCNELICHITRYQLLLYLISFHFFGKDLASGIHAKKLSDEEAEKISTFLERAYIRLNSWFHWFNTTQSGELFLFRFQLL